MTKKPRTLLDPISTRLRLPVELHQSLKLIANLSGISQHRLMVDALRAFVASRDVLGVAFKDWSKRAGKVDAQLGSALERVVDELKREGVILGVSDSELEAIKRADQEAKPKRKKAAKRSKRVKK